MHTKQRLVLFAAALLLLGGAFLGLSSKTQVWTTVPVVCAPNTAAQAQSEAVMADGLETHPQLQAFCTGMAGAVRDCLIKISPKETTAVVPVLMYHHLNPVGNYTTTITPALFEAHMAALHQAGYTALFPDDLDAYVNGDLALPSKPVVITFDDGYLSNYQYAWPTLKAQGMVATIFVVGATIGSTEHYKDTDYPITPHFSSAQGAEMVASGIISIQSHTYDMHQWAPYESAEHPRENILPLPGETEEEYRAALSADCQQIRQAILEGTGEPRVYAMAYPTGKSCDLAQTILLENGFNMTFTTEQGCNLLIKDRPQTLMNLHRFNINEGVSVEQLLEWVAPARGTAVQEPQETTTPEQVPGEVPETSSPEQIPEAPQEEAPPAEE